MPVDPFNFVVQGKRTVDSICDAFEHEWATAERPPLIEAFLSRCPDGLESDLTSELILLDVFYRRKNQDAPTREEYADRFPSHRAVIDAAFDRHSFGDSTDHTPFAELPESPPESIDRYAIKCELGRGGFGIVYLAHDGTLQRDVAIKVPHRHWTRRFDNDTFLAEAQLLASLKHPGIVSVFDAGRFEDDRVYFVSEYVRGASLAKAMRRKQMSIESATDLVASVAASLAYAHREGIVHRDVKPANILLDVNGAPLVADFGLALYTGSASDSWRCGTPRYMSPEQVRSEGHLIDHRSDIFSLGIVYYELLTGRHPFPADDREKLLQRLATSNPVPMTECTPSIHPVLERICMRALAPRAADRYQSATEMAGDLRHFLETRPSTTLGAQTTRFTSRGVRSFQRKDAAFFLRLIPGPRDRNGVPESVRFWLNRIESKDADSAFRVGIIYGPSGCGKSSFVNAGIFPRISDAVDVIHIRATGVDDELRLLEALNAESTTNPSRDFAKAMRAIRRQNELTGARKTLIVVDQFEQILHRKAGQLSEFGNGLRQCDGANLQCILLVRDDFWMAVSRFMRNIEVPIVDGENAAAVELFDKLHAQQVLREYGEYFGQLSRGRKLNSAHSEFLDQAVEFLSEDGHVSPLRLALFAETMKHRPWTPDVVADGVFGNDIVFSYLEQIFHPSEASDDYSHLASARKVLRALTPKEGIKIKDKVKTYDDLYQISGCDGTEQFDGLIELLDNQARLITPVDDDHVNGRHGYQLTHDYLIQPIQQWLERSDRTTRRGRARARLAELTRDWQLKPDRRLLPSLLDYLTIRLVTARSDWTTSERQMMNGARRYHARRLGTVAAMLLAVVFLANQLIRITNARNLANNLATIAPERLLENFENSPIPPKIEPYLRAGHWMTRQLDRIRSSHPSDSEVQLNAALIDYYSTGTGADEICQAIYSRSSQLALKLRRVIADQLPRFAAAARQRISDVKAPLSRRLRAALVLAGVPDDPLSSECCQRWSSEIVLALMDELLEDPSAREVWVDGLGPINSCLQEALLNASIDRKLSIGSRDLATELMLAWSDDCPTASLVEILANNNVEKYQAVIGLLRERQKEAIPLLRAVADDGPAQERSIASLALISFGLREAWDVLRASTDPTPAAFAIDATRRIGFERSRLTSRFRASEPGDDDLRPNLLLAIGWASAVGDSEFLPDVLHTALTDPNGATHSAAEWICRRWDAHRQLIETLHPLATGRVEDNRRWYITRQQGHTMIIVHATRPVLLGTLTGVSPVDKKAEQPSLAQIPRRFAISSTEVTIDQFQNYFPQHNYDPNWAFTTDSPMNSVSWIDAARYCNRLSQEEGLDESEFCYIVDEDGVRIPPDCLTRTGYRLPTSREWECACRGGTFSSRYFGESRELLSNYEWYDESDYGRVGEPTLPTSMPVGRLMPNPRGLFDMLGNVQEWCHDVHDDTWISPNPPAVVIDKERLPDDGVVNPSDFVLVRGGKYKDPPIHLRAASIQRWEAEKTGEFQGFRVARTMPSGIDQNERAGQ